MANQMIALGIKPVQLPDLGAATARMSNVMANMAVAKEKQAGIQRANAFRQLVSSPQFDPSNPEHIKAAQSLDPAGTEKIISGYDSRQKAQLERIGEQTKQFRDILVTIDPADKESYTQFRADVVAAVPGWGKFLPTPEQWNADARLRTLMKADDVILKTIPTPTASAQQDASGNFYGVTVGGLNPPTATPVQEMTMGGQGGPLEAAPPVAPGERSARLSADLASPLLNVRDEASYQQALQMIGTVNPDAANQLRRVMPRFDPARMEGIRNEAFAAFRAVPQPSQGLVAGERGGVGGPFEPTGRQFRGKPPMQAPLPGSAQVPISRVREEAAAGRKTPAETYAEKRSEKQAMSDVDFLDAYESSKTDAQNILSVIDQMIGDLNVDKQGRVIRGKRKPHPGFESVVGAGVPGLRFIPGTQSADFDAFLEQVQGGAFLKAYNALRGTGQITEKEGEKATTALSRMKRSQSEAGFIKAAREFEGLVRSAMERADRRAARLRGTQPTRKNNIDDLLKMYGD